MKTYPSLRYPGEEETKGLFAAGTIIIQEKLDGSNFRFTWNPEDGFTYGSRRTEGDGLHEEQFSDTIWYIDSFVNRDALERQYEEYGELVYFGEAMNPHTISYDWEDTPDFLGFDIWSVEENSFMSSEHTDMMFTDINLPTVPMLDVVDAEDWDDYDFECPPSRYSDEKAEGVVFKNHDTGVYGKFVREDFKEKNQKRFGKPKKYQESGAEKLSYQYVTQARIEKAAHRLVDEGDYTDIKMEIMRDLPKEVIRDMADEEAYNIFIDESWEVDLGEFRSNISSRCAEVLKQMVDKQMKEAL